MPTAEQERVEPALDSLERIVDAGGQLQEAPDTIAEYMRDDHPVRRAIEISERPRVDAYAGTSAFPLYHYKRRDEEGNLMTKGALESSNKASEEEDDEVLMPSQYGDIEETIGGEAVADLYDGLGIDVGVVNPTLHKGLPEVQNDRFAVEMARAYNSWLLDQLDEDDNLVGNLVIAPQVPEKAAEEIDDRAEEEGIVGLQLPATGLHPPPGHRQYDPIYEAAERHELPISMQATVGGKTFPQQFSYAKTYAEDFTMQPSFAHIVNITSIMYNGVLERFSDLDFVIQNGGLGFAPYLKHRLDDHYLELGYEIPELEQMPSDYLRESFYWCTQPIGYPSTKYIVKMIEMIGTDNVMYSSDVPHPNTDQPVDLIAKIGEEFDHDTLEKIMGRTAVDLFGL
jgi:predicted TIM-barrel fold metal-dependent hydrolase